MTSPGDVDNGEDPKTVSVDCVDVAGAVVDDEGEGVDTALFSINDESVKKGL